MNVMSADVSQIESLTDLYEVKEAIHDTRKEVRIVSHQMKQLPEVFVNASLADEQDKLIHKFYSKIFTPVLENVSSDSSLLRSVSYAMAVCEYSCPSPVLVIGLLLSTFSPGLVNVGSDSSVPGLSAAQFLPVLMLAAEPFASDRSSASPLCEDGRNHAHSLKILLPTISLFAVNAAHLCSSHLFRHN